MSDLDGDGNVDFIAGASGTTTSTSEGTVYVVSTNPDCAIRETGTINYETAEGLSTTAGDRLGESASNMEALTTTVLQRLQLARLAPTRHMSFSLLPDRIFSRHTARTVSTHASTASNVGMPLAHG